MFKSANEIFHEDTAASSSDDEISLTSTVMSEHGSDEQYLVETILGEKIDDEGQNVFLVKWEGYPVERSTWEPMTVFDNWDDIRKSWEKKKESGEPFDWQRWDTERLEEEEERMIRKRKREAKRRKLRRESRRGQGISKPRKVPVRSHSVSDGDLSDFVVGDDRIILESSSDSELDLTRPRKLRSGKSVEYISSDEESRPSASASEAGNESDEPKGKYRRIAQANRMRKEKAQAKFQADLGQRGGKAVHRTKTTEPNHITSKNTAPKPVVPTKRAHPPPSPKSSKVPPKLQKVAQKVPPRTAPGPSIGTARRTTRPGLDLRYNRLSVANNAAKRGRAERAPDINHLSLMRPSEMSRSIGPVGDIGINNLSLNQSNEPTGAMSHVLSSLAQKIAPSTLERTNEPKRVARQDTWKQPLLNPVNPSFECELVYGSTKKNLARNMGNCKFIGFSEKFTKMIHDNKIFTMWISRSLENYYIQNVFVTELGPPLEFGDLDITSDECDSFMGALAILHGAGVVLNEFFTLIVFQPQNDVLSKAFTAPQQKARTHLRAVAYPPLNLSDIQLERKPGVALLRSALDDEYKKVGYLPQLVHSITGHGYKQERVCHYVVYCPDMAADEERELHMIMKLFHNKMVPHNDVPVLCKSHPRYPIRVFVHSTQRPYLHTIPALKLLRDVPFIEFYFFGLHLEAVGTRWIRDGFHKFWVFGTVILLTPRFVAGGSRALGIALQYQSNKSGSTTLCIPSTFLERVQELVLARTPAEDPKSREALLAAFKLVDRKRTGEVLECPVTRNTYDELETLADAFGFWQTENTHRFRKFVICHAADERPRAAGLYNTIEFRDPEVVENVMLLPKRPSIAKPPPSQEKQ